MAIEMDGLLELDEEQQAAAGRERVKKSVLADIERANSFYQGKIEPTLRIRHQLYEADRAYYKNLLS